MAVLDDLARTRGLPQGIVCDNGPEFTSRAFDAWAYQRRLKLLFIRPGKPVENAFIESFNGRFRDECLSMSWFLGLADARARSSGGETTTTARARTAGLPVAHPAALPETSLQELHQPTHNRGASSGGKVNVMRLTHRRPHWSEIEHCISNYPTGVRREMTHVRAWVWRHTMRAQHPRQWVARASAPGYQALSDDGVCDH